MKERTVFVPLRFPSKVQKSSRYHAYIIIIHIFKVLSGLTFKLDRINCVWQDSGIGPKSVTGHTAMICLWSAKYHHHLHHFFWFHSSWKLCKWIKAIQNVIVCIQSFRCLLQSLYRTLLLHAGCLLQRMQSYSFLKYILIHFNYDALWTNYNPQVNIGLMDHGLFNISLIRTKSKWLWTDGWMSSYNITLLVGPKYWHHHCNPFTWQSWHHESPVINMSGVVVVIGPILQSLGKKCSISGHNVL